jgi:hypothetical protein
MPNARLDLLFSGTTKILKILEHIIGKSTKKKL